MASLNSTMLHNKDHQMVGSSDKSSPGNSSMAYSPSASDSDDDSSIHTSNHPITLISTKPNLKRSHATDTNNQLAGPEQKKARPMISSSIRTAINRSDGPRGILLFFKQATEEEHRDWIEQTFEGDKDKAEIKRRKKEKEEHTLVITTRARATACKQKQRAIMTMKEISNGLCSPEGRKINISQNPNHHSKNLTLHTYRKRKWTFAILQS